MAFIGKHSLSGVGLTTVLSTELNSLASGAMCSLSSAYANDTNLDLYVDIEVNLASFTPTSTSAVVGLYMAEAVDGTNYPAQAGTQMQQTTTQHVCQIPVGQTAATAQRVVARGILIPPGKFKFAVVNGTGASLAASGNTVKVLPHNWNLNG